MARRTTATVLAAWIGAGALIVATVLTVLWPRTTDNQSRLETPAQSGESESSFEAFVLDSRFFPSGWMGDGKYGDKHLTIAPVSSTISGEQMIALQVEYSPGPEGWAGVYWQYPDGNWGEQPGISLVGAGEITFLARGANGGEVVEFKSGGIHGQYSDSFEKSLGNVALTKEWKTYSIDLRGESLTSVIGVFAWIAPAATGEPVSFWLADLQVR